MRWSLAPLLLGTTASCAIVLQYDDYREQQAISTGGAGTTSTSTSSAVTTSTSGSGGTGGMGGAPLVADWAHRAGDAEVQAYNHVSIHPSGDILVTGDYKGEVDLLGQTLSSPSDYDFVAARLTAGPPVPIWVKGTISAPPTGTKPPRVGMSIAGRASGSVYMTAFLADDSTGTNRGVLIEADPGSGAQLAITPFSVGSDGKSWVLVDSDDRVRLVTEAKDGQVAFGKSSVAGDGGASGKDIAVVTCPASGPCDGGAIAILGGPLDESAMAAAADPAPGGALFLTGEYRGSWAGLPDSGPVASPFVTKVSAGGAAIWARGFVKTEAVECGPSPLEVARGYAVATTASGDVLVTGVMCADTDFGPDLNDEPVVLSGKGGADVFVVKLAGSSGKVMWARSFGAKGHQAGTGIAVGPGDTVYVTGTFSETIDFGGGRVLDAGTGAQSIFLAQLDASGQHLRSADYGAGEPVVLRPIGLAAGKGSLVLAGSWQAPLSFGDGTTLAPHGELDMFLAKFSF